MPTEMPTENSTIIYTETDEAPALATYSLLPIIQRFCSVAGVSVETRDISLAGRMIASFPNYLREDQRIDDALSELGELAKTPAANIIKLPNISASMPQLKACIAELQEQGYALPDYPEEPESDEQRDVRARYDKIKGSAVNPVLREGNSDRRAPPSVKQYAKDNPHSMGAWQADSKTHVASMSRGDFFSSEQSATMKEGGALTIALLKENGEKHVLKDNIAVLPEEIVDAALLSVAELRAFIAAEIDAAKEAGVLFSLHLKATMMKVSDPVIFGHVVSVFYRDVFEKYGSVLDELGVDVSNGLGDVYDKIQHLPDAQRAAIEADIAAVYAQRPDLAMVNSDKGITNLHVPSDVIIDASMPAMIRTSGQMWDAAGAQQDTKAVIPDRCYAGVYQEVIDFCRQHGAFNPSTMGSVPNVGLMAQKAEEYGSHDKTFILPAAGRVQVTDASGNVIFEHTVEEGDIWRMCQVKDAPIRDWVRLAVARARATGAPAVFWLDRERAHDAQLIKKVNSYLSNHDTAGLDILIKSPIEATRFSLERIRKGQDTISVTGNVLRDYLTDLFPILELGTSAKMLSIVPLMNGGGLFETGAGGSAPKHVQQFEQEGHLRWDSLGEFLALAASLEHLAESTNNPGAKVLADTLDTATAKFLSSNKSPSRKVNELDNRGSHFYLAVYWAEALAAQTDDTDLAAAFDELALALAGSEAEVVNQLNGAQGVAMNIGGYFHPDREKASAAMRPSTTLNELLA